MRLIVSIIFALGLVTGVAAQSSPPPGQSQPPAAGAAPSSPPAAEAPDADDDTPPARGVRGQRQPDPKRAVCQDKVRKQGLRGQQMRDQQLICIEEARLACTKKAVEQKIPNRERRDFIRNCTG